MAHHRVVVHPLVLRDVQVRRVYDVTPRMRRVTLAGDTLAAFSRDGLDLPAFATPAFDDHVKIILASDGDVSTAVPMQLENGIEWTPSDTRLARDYTPRRFDPVSGELDLDFVTHGHGPAATWARRARPGDTLWFVGPKSSTVVPEDVDWVLMAGDETALPAIGRFFEERPTDAPVRAVISIADPAARQELALRPTDQVEWIVADPTDREALAAAVAAIEPLSGTPYVWAAGESRALLPLRRHVSRTLGAAKSHTNITGYWNEREDVSAGAGPTADDGALVLAPPPVAWFAVRTALQIGLLDAVADATSRHEPLTSAEAARRTGAEPARLDILVRTLEAHQILVRGDSGGLSLTVAGDELVGDEHLREHYDGFHADQVLALTELTAALTDGANPWQSTRGRTVCELAESDAAVYEEFVEGADGLPHLLTSLPKHAAWRGAERIGITGPGALAVADVLHEHLSAHLTIVEPPVPLAVLRAVADDSPHEFAETWQPQDVVVTALALDHRTDDEIAGLLEALREVAATVLMVEQLAPDALNPMAMSQVALMRVATVGSPHLDPARLDALAVRSGWTVASQHKLGWGVECVELVPRDA